MSTLRVDKIKSRTGSVVTIPEGQTLAVTGIGSIIGDANVTGNLNVSGAFNLVGASQFNTNAGIATFGKLRVGNGTTEAVDFHITNSMRIEKIIGIGSEVSIDGPNKRIHGIHEAHLNEIRLGTVGLAVTTNASGGLAISDSTGVKRDLAMSDPIIMTTSDTLLPNRSYYGDTAGGTVTGTLPSEPYVNDFVSITDYQGYWNVNSFIITPGATTGPATVISGAAQDLECDVERASVTLQYTGIQTTGWILK